MFHFFQSWSLIFKDWKKWSLSSLKASLIAQLVKNLPAVQERAQFNSWVGKILWSRDRLPTPVFLGFPCGSAGKESACNVGDLGLIPGLGRSPGEGNSYPLQYSSLKNVHGVTKSRTQLSDFHFTTAAAAKSLQSCLTKLSINHLLSPYYDPGIYFALSYILHHLFLTMIH